MIVGSDNYRDRNQIRKQRTDAKIKERRLREKNLKEAIDKSLLKLSRYWKTNNLIAP